MGYVHVEIGSCQSSKRSGDLCGDVVAWERTTRGTSVVLSDGIGSGIKANLAATMTVSRIHELLRREWSLREAVASVAGTMDTAKQSDLPYACFAAVRIKTDGEATILTYEMPQAIFVSNKRFATVLPRRPLVLDGAIVNETSCYIESGEALLLVSDGITQAGLGRGLRTGWGIEGVCRYVNSRLTAGLPVAQLAASVHHEAHVVSDDVGRSVRGDDCTVVMAMCRPGKSVNVLTGPPSRTDEDAALVRRFMQMEGQKVVCGGTTARLVARHTGQRIDVRQEGTSMIAPPDYLLAGVDLATEGAVTLNQAYNILEEDPARYEEASGVSRLCELLRATDRVSFIVGKTNEASRDDIAFRQRGILPRETIVPLISEKLQKAGKLVTVEYV